MSRVCTLKVQLSDIIKIYMLLHLFESYSAVKKLKTSLMGFNTKAVAIATTSVGCYLRFLIDVWYNFDLAATTIELNDVSHRVSRPRTTFQMLLHRQRKPLGQCTRYSEYLIMISFG